MSSFVFMRSLARLFGSIFFPFFRVWGETEIRPERGCIYMARNFGLLTWISALRAFKKPFRFVSADQSDNLFWFWLATVCGLEPIKLSGDVNHDFLRIENLYTSKETVLLLLPENPDQATLDLVNKIKATAHLTSLFMAIAGARTALRPDSLIPRACAISLFCGMPHPQSTMTQKPLAELEFLEKAVADIPLNELPSIFFNHSRNL
ncbi:MAG: hypothetical protein CVV41_11495 [Candidatus Riflebacteria bacterium HGW-Riflebacteria-1]|jgi:hypothetical protein|nr:MAG: hypothetical protein CVV41_11495 [Candidatus Riflebacteria bacterium HGW-Riflebacteria-1]